MEGVSKAVNIPFKVNPKLAKAPYFPLISIAVEVPTAWAAVPIDNPCAIGLPIFNNWSILNPQIAPNNPTKITTAAVKAGIPPIVFVTSIAIGVVTDFGAKDNMISWLAPIALAISTTETTPTKHPASCERTIGNICFFIVYN